MNSGNGKLTCAKARNIDIVEYLSGLDYEPSKIRNYNYWFLSPLHLEKTASFKVDRKLNRWYDHGIGKGGNLIDFGILYHRCTVTEFLKLLEGNVSFHQHHISSGFLQRENKVEIIGIGQLDSPALIKYLNRRQIPFAIAVKYCKEVRFKLGEKTLFGIGFLNDLGGFEIRNTLFKISSSPKGITTIKNGFSKIALFEGFISFLSFLVCCPRETNVYDFLILNSLSFLEKSIADLDEYGEVHLFLDNDKSGQNCSRRAIERDSRFIDKSVLYSPYKDWNDWLVSSHNPSVIARPP